MAGPDFDGPLGYLGVVNGPGDLIGPGYVGNASPWIVQHEVYGNGLRDQPFPFRNATMPLKFEVFDHQLVGHTVRPQYHSIPMEAIVLDGMEPSQGITLGSTLTGVQGDSYNYAPFQPRGLLGQEHAGFYALQ